MRKMVIHGLGALALFLGGSAMGQEKPPPPKPVVELLRAFKADVQARDRTKAVFQLRGDRVTFATNGVFLREGRTSSPLIKGELARTVTEMKRALHGVADAHLPHGLSALETVERAAMKARRILAAQKQPVEPSEGDEASSEEVTLTYSTAGTVRVVGWVAGDGDNVVIRFHREGQEPEPQTPLQEAQASLRAAITSFRGAGDTQEAKAALDDLDERVTALRVLLWEKQSSESPKIGR